MLDIHLAEAGGELRDLRQGANHLARDQVKAPSFGRQGYRLLVDLHMLVVLLAANVSREQLVVKAAPGRDYPILPGPVPQSCTPRGWREPRQLPGTKKGGTALCHPLIMG